PDPVLLLERGGERLAVGDRHRAVEQDLALLLRAFDEPLVAVGARVHVDVAVGWGLREGGRPKAGERGGEAGQTLHEGTKCNRGARQIADITVYIIGAVKPAGTHRSSKRNTQSTAGANPHRRHRPPPPHTQDPPRRPLLPRPRENGRFLHAPARLQGLRRQREGDDVPAVRRRPPQFRAGPDVRRGAEKRRGRDAPPADRDGGREPRRAETHPQVSPFAGSERPW